MPLHEEILDFENNHETAQEWILSNQKKWNDILHTSNSQAQFAHFIKYDYDFINLLLDKHEGKIINNFERIDGYFKRINADFNQEKLHYYNDTIVKIEHVISQHKLDHAIKIYTSFLPPYSQSSINNPHEWISPRNLSRFSASEIIERYNKQKITNYGFFTGNLTNDFTKVITRDRKPIIFEINLPRSMEIGYINHQNYHPNQPKIIVNRNYSWEIKTFKIIDLHNQKTLKGIVKLIDNRDEMVTIK